MTSSLSKALKEMLSQQLLLQARGKKRGSLAILSDMLSHAAKGISKTEMMRKVGLSSAQMDRYIPVLLGAKLLEVFNHSKRAVYRTTDKGRSFLNIFDQLISLLD